MLVGKMSRLFGFDVETYSPVDLVKYGGDAYAQHPDTRCLLFAYHDEFSPAPPKLWLEGEPPPEDFVRHIRDGGFLSGWNVCFFDRWIYNRILVIKHGFPPIPDDNWLDSMQRAVASNLPRSLAQAAKFCEVSFDTELKGGEDHRLRRITNANKTVIPANTAEILKNLESYPATLLTVVSTKTTLGQDLRWLAAHCVQDVLMEERVLHSPRLLPWPQVKPWIAIPAIDRQINDLGPLMDRPLVAGMARAAELEAAWLDGRIYELTRHEVQNTAVIGQLKAWLLRQGVPLPLVTQREKKEDTSDETEAPKDRKSPWKLEQTDIADLLSLPDEKLAARGHAEVVRQVLNIRADASKISAKKLRTMLGCAGPDDRLRGGLILGGAQQTMRWAGSRWNPHNFPRGAYPSFEDVAKLNGLNEKRDAALITALSNQSLAAAIELGRSGNADLIRLLHGGVLPWISRMLRRTLGAPEGSLLINGDYSQIEARITVWLAQQMDMLEAYEDGTDVYVVMAAGIFNLPPEEITPRQRQVGKTVILACGFGGGAKALIRMAFKYNILMTIDEAEDVVKKFRKANRATSAYWYATDYAAHQALQNPGIEYPVPPLGLVSYRMEDRILKCRLPSGRDLFYREPHLRQEKWESGEDKDKLSLYALAVRGTAYPRSLYHTVLVENCVQAIAADILATGLCNMSEAGFQVPIHVHDQAAAEVREDRIDALMPVFKDCMLSVPGWAASLPINAKVGKGARFE
jgi:DNA polymerase